MDEVFGQQIKEALDYAQKLKLSGEDELSGQLCLECVKKVSLYHGEDILSLFYGENVYSHISDVSDAAKYIFISKCAERVYDRIYPLKSSKSPTGFWAKKTAAESNSNLCVFFQWLQKSNRRAEAGDCGYFKKLLNGLSKVEIVYFKMAERVQQMTLLEIVRGLVQGSVTYAGGELR